MQQTILKISNLTKRYNNIVAINNLSFEINKGNVYGILGPNGSGKTTTLSIISEIIKPDSGSFEWNINNKNYRAKIGTLIESPNFYSYLTIYQNLKISCLIKNINENEIERALVKVKLNNRKNSIFSNLSFGMKQRLALASILISDPEVIVLDEPTNGLDPEGIAEFRQIIVELANQGKTIILASHILDEIEKVCTHVAILKNGKLIANDTVSKILKHEQTFIISSDDNETLFEFIVKSGIAKNVNKTKTNIEIVLQDDFNAKKLNEFLFKNNFILTQLFEQENNLEKQFLEIIKVND